VLRSNYSYRLGTFGFGIKIFLSGHNKLEENLKIKHKIHIATEQCQSFKIFKKRNCEISLEVQGKGLEQVPCFKGFV